MNERKQWLIRMTGLILILAMAAGYQMKALSWQALREQNEAAVLAAEQYNAAILQQERQSVSPDSYAAGDSGKDSPSNAAAAVRDPSGQSSTAGKYRDGSYTASARGFGGDITLTVTVSGGVISDIDINDSSSEDKVYFDMAAKLADEIIALQTPDVDAVSGATFSSNGIKEAVLAALKEAEQE